MLLSSLATTENNTNSCHEDREMDKSKPDNLWLMKVTIW